MNGTWGEMTAVFVSGSHLKLTTALMCKQQNRDTRQTKAHSNYLYIDKTQKTLMHTN